MGVMFQLLYPSTPPSLSEVSEAWGIPADALDGDFGVIVVDPEQRLAVVLVDERAVPDLQARLAARPEDPRVGVFSNPPVEPFR